MKNKVDEQQKKLAASLFTGIGGIELGLAKAGFSTTLLCEIDPGAIEVLRERFPGIPIYPDVRDINPALMSDVNLLSAGFPCQDLSQAGSTNGIKGKNSGLVSNVFRILREVSVPWVLLENVPFMLQLNKGSAMDYVVSNLESLGYNWAYRVVDTRSFGIPQRRERVYLLASTNEEPAPILFAQDEEMQPMASHEGRPCGFYWTEGNRGLGWAVDAVPTLKGGSGLGIPSPPAVWLPDGRFVTPSIETAEALQGFEPGWTQPAEKKVKPNYRWKLVGNAVTVDAAAWIGERLLSEPGHTPISANFLRPRGSWPTAAFGSSAGRYEVKISTCPVRNTPEPLSTYLKFGTRPLSMRAASGFTERLKRSGLKCPPKFIEDLERYVSSGIS